MKSEITVFYKVSLRNTNYLLIIRNKLKKKILFLIQTKRTKYRNSGIKNIL
jgi:hypothetical protein